MADSEPVTTRLGPRSRPMSSALGWRGEFDDRSIAAGRLLTRQEEAAAIQEEATGPAAPISRPGAPHTRATYPRATATANSPANRAGLADRAAFERGSLPLARCTTTTANPRTSTGTAGLGTARTITVAPTTPTMPAPHRGTTGSIGSRPGAVRSFPRHTISTAMV